MLPIKKKVGTVPSVQVRRPFVAKWNWKETFWFLLFSPQKCRLHLSAEQRCFPFHHPKRKKKVALRISVKQMSPALGNRLISRHNGRRKASTHKQTGPGRADMAAAYRSAWVCVDELCCHVRPNRNLWCSLHVSACLCIEITSGEIKRCCKNTSYQQGWCFTRKRISLKTSKQNLIL